MKKVISVLLPFIAALTLLAGCGSDNGQESTAVCFVLGTHANFPALNVNTLYDKVYNACLSYGSVAAVVVDGEGRVAADYQINPPQVQVDRQKAKQIAEANTAQILQSLSSVSAEVPEADALSALWLGRDLLVDKAEPRKELVVVDSLLSTTGLLDFSASNLIEQEPEIIVAQLRERRAIPDLSGVDVKLLGLGQTCGEQAKLTPDYTYRLQAIWLAILDAAGCRSVEVSSTPLGGAEPEGLPYVSSVPVIEDSLSFDSTAIPEVIRFDDETSLRFHGDSARFVDRVQAEETVRPIAQVLRDNPTAGILLAGMTASVGGDGLELSLARAEAVKTLLVGEGVPPEQITCLGLGRRENCLRVEDLDSAGRLIENQAKRNRAVFLLLRGSATARTLLTQAGEVTA